MELSFHVYIFPLELAICVPQIDITKYNTKYNKNPTFFSVKNQIIYTMAIPIFRPKFSLEFRIYGKIQNKPRISYPDSFYSTKHIGHGPFPK